MALLFSLLLFVVLAAAMLAVFSWCMARWATSRFMPSPSGRFVDVTVDGRPFRFHVFDRAASNGRGDESIPVLLVHGLGGQLRHFEYGVAQTLARERRVVSVDRPGSGLSTRDADAPADPAAQARQLLALTDAIGLGPAIVVGHSLGGALALTFALQHPDRVRALALIAPLTCTPQTLSPVFLRLRIESPLLRRLVAWTVYVPLAIMGGRAAVAQVFAPEQVPDDYAYRGGGALSLRPWHYVAASKDIMELQVGLERQMSRYGELKLPIEFLSADLDELLEPSWQIAGLVHNGALNVNVQRMKAGHMLPVTQPRAVVDAVLRAAARLA